MKKKILIGIAAVVLIAVAYLGYQFATTRSHSPLQVTEASSNGLDVSISYCRPFKKGRVIFGDASTGALQPNGKYWRLGANDATEISFSKNVTFAGKPLPAGKYRMYAVPSAGAWQISLNSELGKFGYMEPDYKLDVLKVDVPLETAPETEQLTINLDKTDAGVNIVMLWDAAKVVVPVQAQ